MKLRPIGFLKTPFRQKFATPRQPSLVQARARLKIDSDLVPEHALRGLEEFSHVWLVFWFHLNTNKMYKPVVHPPRLKGKTIGVFASRAPHRPNPIGLTLARLDGVDGDTLFLSGIDVVDGTPVLDVKPYVPQYDFAPQARSGWVGRVEPELLEVLFSAEAEATLARVPDPQGFRALIADVLAHDPRNPRDRAQRADGKVLGFLLEDCDVLFSISGRTATVHAIERGSKRKPSR